MNIKPIVYENLTIQQRVTASTDALMRSDMKELKRLIETCQQKTYTQPDQVFSDALIVCVLALYGIDSSKKIDLLLALKPLLNGNEAGSAQAHTFNIIHTHKRHAKWPPENLPEGHKVSDEFVT